MPRGNRNVFGISPQTNPLISEAGAQSRFWQGFKPMGLLTGEVVGYGNSHMLQLKNHVATNLNASAVTTADGDPTLLQFVTGTTQHDNSQIQLSVDDGTTAFALGKIVADKRFWLEMRCKVSADINDCALVFGLCVADTTILASSAVGFTEGAFFFKAGGAATALGTLRVSSTSTSTAAIATMANDTWITLGIRSADGDGSVEFWVDGVPTIQTTLTNVPTGNLVPTIAFGVSDTTTKTLKVSRYCFFKEANDG